MSSYVCGQFIAYWVGTGTEVGGMQNQVIWEGLNKMRGGIVDTISNVIS